MAPVDVIREVLAAAAATVALPFRAATVLRDGRAIVVRAEAFADGRPVSTIIKRFKVGYHEHFLRERAGLRLLSNLGGGLVPALLGENEGELTLVLQDVNNGLSLDTIIASSDTATATRALLAVATQLGTLHARARSFGLELRALPPTASPGDVLISCLPSILRFVELACGTTAARSARPAILDLAARVNMRANDDTLTLGDLAPSNILVVDRAAVFLDLEYCGHRHPFYDAVFWRCICPMPSAVRTAMDAAYRQGSREGGAELSEAKFEQEMLLFAAHRAFWTLSWNMDAVFVADRDFVPGVSTRAILRRYLDECLVLSKRHRATPPDWIDVLATLAERLAELWRDAEPTLELPCFSGADFA
jgi:hypothetical protein